MTTLSPIVTREELMVLRSLERAFIDQWTKTGSGEVPRLPHMPALGRGVRFHLPSVDAWLLKHFQVGGVEE
jgi:predicted DNA-binding transcriptional regulator AlpA